MNYYLIEIVFIAIFIIISAISIYKNIGHRKKSNYLLRQLIQAEDKISFLNVDFEEKSKELQRLGEIGKELSSLLSVDEIIDLTYIKIKDLISSSTFLIGIYNESEHTIEVNRSRESEEIMYSKWDCNDKTRPAVLCFDKQIDMFTNCFSIDYKIFFPILPKPIQGGGLPTESVIYCPLTVKEKRIGVISVQDFNKNAFSNYHLQIVKNLANYVAIAIDNAKAYNEIKKQKAIVDEKNKDITDSIRYSKRIQDAILPPPKLIKQLLSESFVLYKPKDIVAGDFYWMEREDDKIFFTAADCTGHGVPGAMLSVMCSNALSKSVKELRIYEPAKILDKVVEILEERFEKSEEDIWDGMDLALCCLNLQAKKLEFSGANNQLYLIRNGELNETKGDRQPVGKHDNRKPFTNHTIEIQTGDSIYVSTDGYADQFGGTRDKKFTYRRFRKLMVSISEENMSEQMEVMDSTIEEWKGKTEQIDDICIIGVRV